MTAYFFRHNEPRYFGFGLKLGVTNLFRNGFSLGLKRTVGLVTQPINSHWRYAEYDCIGDAVAGAVERCRSSPTLRILDVGSPKCFGLFLAYHFGVQAHLTDIDEPTVQEAEQLWTGVKRKARGQAHFSLQDARSLGYPDSFFDVVFAMSVVEHIEGDEGDSQAVREMMRVLKPGGTLAVSVPFGETYEEQEIMGFQGAARKTNDSTRYFFQRIYSPAAVEVRLLRTVPGLILKRAASVGRRGRLAWLLHGRLGLAPGLFGFLYPVLSTLSNSVREGLAAPPGRYASLNTARDIYGDAILVWNKQVDVEEAARPSESQTGKIRVEAG